MEQSYLFDLIRSLSKEEMSQILEYATLSYVNNGKMKAFVAPLLQICFKHVQNQNSSIEKETVFARLFLDEAYKEGKLEKTMVEAAKVIRSYLISKSIFKPEKEFNQILEFSEILRLRGLGDRYKMSLARLQKMQQAFEWRNVAHYYRQFQLEDAIHDFECLNNLEKGDLNIPNVLYNLDIFYYLQRVNRLNSFLLQRKAASFQEDPMIKSLIENEPIAPANYIEECPALEVQVMIFQLLKKTEPDPKDALVLFNLMQKHAQALDPELLRSSYAYLRNMCVLIANNFSDDEEIRITLFKLYQDNLYRGYLHFEGLLHPSTLLAVTYAAVRVNEFEWLKSFLEEYKNQVFGDNENRDYYRLNVALYQFGIQQYEGCLDFIPSSSNAVEYLLIGKRLEIKALFELKSDLLDYRIYAFKMYFSRTSHKLIPEFKKKQNTEFINLLTQICNSMQGDNNRADRLINRIKEKKQAAEWRWLIEKAQALKKR